MDRTSFWTTIIFAVCLIAFGYVGYHKTGSAMSLYSSLTFGILLLGASFFSQKVVIILTALLSAMFVYRTIVTHKPVPIILAIVSGAMFCFLLYRASRRQH